MLPWWRHVAPKSGVLRVAAALEDGRLVGIAPFLAERLRGGLWRYRLLSSGTAAPLEPLAAIGREREVARLFGQILREARPRPAIVSLDGIVVGSPRYGLIETAGSDRVRCHSQYQLPLPMFEWAGGYESWLSSRSRNFRWQMGRARRTLNDLGGRLRLTTSDAELSRDLAEFARLHHARWANRGGSRALVAGVEAMLSAAAPTLLRKRRLHLAVAEIGDRVIGAQAFLAAGDHLCWWLGGSDDEYSACRPAHLTCLHVLENTMKDDPITVELGPGGQPFKRRLTDETETLDWLLVAPRRTAYPLARGYALPAELRRRIGAAVGAETGLGSTLRAVDDKLTARFSR
jgi:CelD/BcsL family acetyltransferase involved in cellulose biosynthesis